ASTSCKETEKTALPADAFGFSTGSDVSDLGAWAMGLEYNGAFTGNGFKPGTFASHLGKVQLSTSFVPCWEVGPYFLATTAVGTNRGVIGDLETTTYGFGVENKYKLLGRATHGVGLTLVFDPNYQSFRSTNTQVTPNLRWSGDMLTSTYKVLLDKELIAGKLFGAVNVQWDQIWTERPGLVNPVAGTSDYARNSVLTLSAALAWQALDGFFVGAETRYVRTHNGLFFNTTTGDALFVGPTAYWQVTKNISASGTWGVQVAGKAKFAVPATTALNLLSSDLNLVTQPQHIAKFKIAVSF
ncbi:MAG TPA: hypothetical protein PK812_11315, partial [Beijerinckiaceae bacterium]|nr:hypothetical protein [Beijerinckiaceae bacterium]